MSDPSEQAAMQKERADKAEVELENYKKEAKDLQEFLQAEATKKQAEIRKLKEESIMKEKNYKIQRAQLALLQSEIAALKQQATKAELKSNETSDEIIKKLQQQNKHLLETNLQLNSQVEKKKSQILQLQSQRESESSNWEGLKQELNQKLQESRIKIEQLSQQKLLLEKQVNSKLKQQSLKTIEIKKQSNEIERKNSKKQINISKDVFEKERQRYEQKIKTLGENLAKTDKLLKDSKLKCQSLQEENQSLQKKINNLSNMNMNISMSSAVQSSPMMLKSSIQEENDWNGNKLSYSCLLITKPHYISPFLEIYQDKKLINIYKSTRSGCFQKSMGCYKHKVDTLTFELDQLIHPIVSKIIQSQQQENHHSILIYGVKKSTKKYIMAKIVASLQQYLLEKLNNCDEQEISSIFMRRSAEQQKNFTHKGNDKEAIIQIIDKVIFLGVKKDKSKQKYVVSPRKTISKPKVRYFNLKISDFYLEIGTSSFTNLSFRQKMTPNNMLSNILYSKLPNILQSAISQKHLILTLNPIVQLYDQCRNTLSTTLCRGNESRQQQEQRDWRSSPIREELSDLAKKKLQSIERENQQTSLRFKKLQDECQYYKTRFDELEFRLKNLLNTHSGQVKMDRLQNTYLKKSPITLSYEKLLKFVHSVQSRSTNANLSQINSSVLKNNIYIDKDQSVDAL